jgi:BirA family biotin operon repressor/biotin-[acetyl-CoA-carboxylase] ligase
LVKNSIPVSEPSGPFDAAFVSSQLPAQPVPWTVQWRPTVGSTQDLVREAAMAGSAEGWTVVTDWQRQGRGRLGRQWVTVPSRDLLFSVLLRPSRAMLSLLPLLAGVAVLEGIKQATGIDMDLKWPNDLLLDGRKVAGILLEHGPEQVAALGVGVNVNSTVSELPQQASSISLLLGHPLPREALLVAILASLGEALQRSRSEGHGWILPSWRLHSSMLGSRVSYEQAGTVNAGVAEDVENDGALRVRLADDRVVRIHAGDVRLLRG